MERLTKISKVGEHLPKKSLNLIYESDSSESNLTEILEKLGEYEDAEEQGLLLRLPCKEAWSQSGDEVYLIYDGEIIKCIHCGLSIDAVEGKAYITLATDENIFPYRNPDPEHDLDPTDWCTDSTSVEVDEIGKAVFFTREEAEVKLKGVEEKESKDASAWKNHIMNRFMREE